jgi:hypothetical protein
MSLQQSEVVDVNYPDRRSATNILAGGSVE